MRRRASLRSRQLTREVTTASTICKAGNSALFANAPGFQRFNLTNVYLGIGRTNQIDATLNVGSASETVEVAAAPAMLQTESSEVATIAARQGAEAEGKSAGDFF